MNGTNLTIGAVATLVAVGLVRRRGSRVASNLMVSVNALVQAGNLDSEWPSTLTPMDLLGSDLDKFLMQMQSAGATDLVEMMEYDIDSFEFWRDRLTSYRGKEKEIPRSWEIEIDESNWIEDGFHRLAAAVAEDLKMLPAKMVYW